MNAYYIWITETVGKRGAKHYTKGVVVAEHAEKALALAKTQYKTGENATWCVTPINTGEFLIISH